MLIAAIGCGGSQTRRATSTAPSITVLDRGFEPRQLLRYVPRVHAPERFTMSLKLRVDTAFANTVLERGNRTIDFPTMVVTARVLGQAQRVTATVTAFQSSVISGNSIAAPSV